MGFYEGDPTKDNPKQIGFARVVSDLCQYILGWAMFSVLPSIEGRDLVNGEWTIITENPKLKGTNFHLATRDAHLRMSNSVLSLRRKAKLSTSRPLDWDAINAIYKKKRFKLFLYIL